MLKNFSSTQDDCITDSHIEIGLKQLPTPYVTIISDTLWRDKKKEEKVLILLILIVILILILKTIVKRCFSIPLQAPWVNLCSWDTRIAVISSTIEYEDQKSISIERELMKYLESSLRSWSDDR